MNGDAEPHVFVVFGGAGDLARRKLLPALFRLHAAGRVAPTSRVLGVDLAALTEHSYRAVVEAALREAGISRGAAAWCRRCVHFERLVGGDARPVACRIAAIEREARAPGNRLFDLAIPPGAVPGTIDSLVAAGLDRGPGWTRLVLEKPFGHDLASARRLHALLHRHFKESQIFRIDHFLGKDTVQNLAVLRFSNALFEPLWNRDRVESVEITVAESLGVEERAGYYEGTGALRDMVENHLTQVLALVAMEPPVAYDARGVREEKLKVLRAIEDLRPDSAVLGQYGPGSVDGRRVRGYRQEPGVSPRSRTETYVALRVLVDTWRWQGVPFYLRTGKRLARRLTRVTLRFRPAPASPFGAPGSLRTTPNVLTLDLQPDEGMSLSFQVKRPGEPFRRSTESLSFSYARAFGRLPDAYETLLLDALLGDAAHFVHADEVEAAWRLYQPLLDRRARVVRYPAGSWGPKAADRLPAEDGLRWESP